MKPEIRDKELQARIFLYHRFGLQTKTTLLDNETISLENLDFELAKEEFLKSYKTFIHSKEHQDRIHSLMLYSFSAKHHRISEKESSQLLHKISVLLHSFHAGYDSDTLTHLLEKQNLVIVPVNTFYIENNSNGNNHSHRTFDASNEKTHQSDHIKAVALFDERLLKINPRGPHKNPCIRVYRVQPYPVNDMQVLLNSFHSSFSHALDHQHWDDALNALTKAEKINTITKKDQNVGNGSWLTLKMILLTIVYAVIYDYCHSKDLKEFESEPLATHIAEGFYKLFIVDDRNRAIQDYLEFHGFHKAISGMTLSVTHRLASIKEFLSIPPDKRDKRNAPDKIMLDAIYVKSLNWLLADYLKKGDIGLAYELLEAEMNNRRWNPLIYAAKNGKIAIAELLGSNAKYITEKDTLGNSPLHYAVQYGHDDIFRVFLRYKKKNKLNLQAKNKQGNTALHLAALNNELEMMELLLHHEPEIINLQNTKGETALKVACDHHNINTIKKLLSNGASTEGLNFKEYSEEIQLQLSRSGRPTLL